MRFAWNLAGSLTGILASGRRRVLTAVNMQGKPPN